MNNPQEIRQKLIDAGFELFTGTGYAETTIRMITERSGIENRSFYYLFESKEDLLRTIVEDLADSEIELLDKISQQPAGPLEKLSEMISSVISSQRGRELMLGLVKKRSIYVNNIYKEQIMEKANGIIQGVIDEGIAKGVMHAPEQISKFILIGVIFLFLNTVSVEEDERDKMLRAYLHMAEASLGLQKGSIRAAF